MNPMKRGEDDDSDKRNQEKVCLHPLLASEARGFGNFFKLEIPKLNTILIKTYFKT